MKKTIATAVILVASTYGMSPIESVKMEGAYRMLSQSANDTLAEGNNQLKIYTEHYVMYAGLDSANETSAFGIGSYTVAGDNVIEKMLYRGADTTVITKQPPFKLDIEKTLRGFRQVIPELEVAPGQKIKLTEEYERVGTRAKSPLDGAWKETGTYVVIGKDTTRNEVTQYKVYYAGHFIWGQTFLDSSRRNFTGVGFGIFKMNGINKMTETVIASTYSSINGQTNDIDISMSGKDRFILSITYPTGKLVEFYERLKE